MVELKGKSLRWVIESGGLRLLQGKRRKKHTSRPSQAGLQTQAVPLLEALQVKRGPLAEQVEAQ